MLSIYVDLFFRVISFDKNLIFEGKLKEGLKLFILLFYPILMNMAIRLGKRVNSIFPASN